MTVDVFYEGFALGRGLSAKRDGERLFVELVPPMPVGTALMLTVDGKEQPMRVASVHEGVIPGVWLLAGHAAEPSAPQKAQDGETTAPQRSKKERRSRSRRDVHDK